MILLLITLAIASYSVSTNRDNEMLNLKLYEQFEKFEDEFDSIPLERKIELEKISDYIRNKKSEGTVNLIFICTHNSRRSHIAQIWGQTLAIKYGIKNLYCWSGGTEATAFHNNAVSAMIDLGFEIVKLDESKNSKYEVKLGSEQFSFKVFSKRYDDPINPKNNFAAIMVCSDADNACPIVNGADVRISLPYEDPKKYDGTDQESEMYKERALQIGRELLYTFSKI